MKKLTILYPLLVEIDDDGKVTGFTEPTNRELEFMLYMLKTPTYETLSDASAVIFNRKRFLRDRYPEATIITNRYELANCSECAGTIRVGQKMRWLKNTGYWCLSCFDTK